MIPFGDLARTYYRLRGEIDPAVAEVLSGGWFILGERLAAFEEAFAAYCGAGHAVGVGSGTDAIALALRALGIGAGDEVITSPLSAAFTAIGIAEAGAVPVFADIEPERCTLDPAQIEARVTSRSRAILPVHLYGQPADMDPILAIARRHGLAVVEDAAQAHGARYGSRRVGVLADAAAFSFYPTKNLGAFGDGGAVTTDDPGLADRVRMLRDGGQSSRYCHELVGKNSRLDELQAAVLLVRLAHLDADNARRRAVAERYDRALAAVAYRPAPAAAAPQAPRATAVGRAANCEHVYHLYVLRASDRKALADDLARSGVATQIHYPTPIHLQKAFGGEWRRGELPVAERCTAEVLSLPMFPELTDDEVATVASALEAALAPPTSA